MYSVYILENLSDKSWYIGCTDNLKRRLKEHINGQGGKTTKEKLGGWKLMYAEAYVDKRDAFGIYVEERGDPALKFVSLINIRPAQGSRSMEIQDEELRRKIRDIVGKLIPQLFV